jgi:hypothetical protein
MTTNELIILVAMDAGYAAENALLRADSGASIKECARAWSRAYRNAWSMMHHYYRAECYE